MSQVLGGSLAAHGLLKPPEPLLVAVSTVGNTSTEVVLPLYGGPYTVDWGDGSPSEEVVSNESAGTGLHTTHPRHDYGASGQWRIAVRGSYHALGTLPSAWGDSVEGGPPVEWTHAVVGIDDWGVGLTSIRGAFRYVTRSVYFPSHLPSSVTDIAELFEYSTGTASVDLSGWDIANVLTMRSMFRQSEVTSLDISTWAPQTLDSHGLYRMFMLSKIPGTLDLTGWVCSGITTLREFLWSASFTDILVPDLDTSAVTDISASFSSYRGMNLADRINHLDMSNVTTAQGAFSGLGSKNGGVNVDTVFTSTWHMPNLEVARSAFSSCDYLEEINIASWAPTAIRHLDYAFRSCDNLRSVDIDAWNVSSVQYSTDAFVGVKLDTDAYDAILIAWGSQTVISGLTFDFGTSQYSSAAAAARQSLIDQGWTIIDGGQAGLLVTVSPLSAYSYEVELPLIGVVDIDIDWGDGSPIEHVNGTFASGLAVGEHTYVAGQYQIKVTGFADELDTGAKKWREAIVSFDGLDGLGLQRLSFAYMSQGITVPTRLPWSVKRVSFQNMYNDSLPTGISEWNFDQLSSWRAMFYNYFQTLQLPIYDWDSSKVTDMAFMFMSGDLSNLSSNEALLSQWDTSLVTDMSHMFYDVDNFNQDISSWNIANVANMKNMLYGTAWSNDNYDRALLAWSQLPVQSNVEFHAGSAQYTESAARAILTGTHGWIITDGGEYAAATPILDLDASALTGLSDGDPVNTWPDNSGLGNDLTGASPTYKTNILNGLPVVRFDGVDDLLSRAALFVAGYPSELTIFTVFIPRGYRVGSPYFHVLAAQGVWPNTTELMHSIDSRNAEGPILATSGATNDFRAGENAYASDVPVLLTAIGKPGSQQMFTNGVLFATNSLATFDPRGSETFYVAGDTDGRYFMGDIAQMVVYNGALSTAEHEAKQTDLMTKWGI